MATICERSMEIILGNYGKKKIDYTKYISKEMQNNLWYYHSMKNYYKSIREMNKLMNYSLIKLEGEGGGMREKKLIIT